MATGDFSCGGGWTWLEHATALGADVSGLGKLTGEIAPGLAADCLLVDIDVPEFSPSWDLTWELVRLGNRDQIIAVFVDGRLRLWRGWPVDWDGRALMQEIAERARVAVQSAPIQRIHPVSRQHRLAAMDDRGGHADTDQRGDRHKASTSQSAI
jgi:5-methylthioadenosine/S-adenosylhomocysteine deaminase